MPRRFVILTHDHPFLHWDLMLEDEDDLRTWRLLAEPVFPSPPIAAEQLPRHRKDYLDYEGPVSANRGSVTRWDAGEFQILGETQDRLQIRLTGTRTSGLFHLQRSAADSPDWEFAFEMPDERGRPFQ